MASDESSKSNVKPRSTTIYDWLMLLCTIALIGGIVVVVIELMEYNAF